MFTSEMRESIKKVEATRKERMATEPRRMTAEEKDALLKGYHPDYRADGFAEIKEKFANVKLFSSKGSHSVNKFGKFGSWGKKDKDPENQMPDTEFVDAEYDETPEDFDGTIEGGEATSTFEEE